MPSISVVIITFNEEQNIQRCLDSVKAIADEIVVVDSFSNDRTEEICRNNDVHFVQHKFEGHIQQKNYSLTQARYDIVLSIDADEALSPQLNESILQVKNHWDADGYTMNRLTNFCGKWIKHCSWYPDAKLRLWNKNLGTWGGTNPHDKFIMSKDAKIKHLKGDLLHYSFYTIDQHINQINKFSSIKAEGLFRKGKKANCFKIIFSPIITFIRMYFVRLGFLDGYYGYVICRNSAHSNFLKYAKLKSLYKNKTKK